MHDPNFSTTAPGDAGFRDHVRPIHGNKHDTVETLFRLAETYGKFGHTGKAKECLDRILAVVPTNVRADA